MRNTLLAMALLSLPGAAFATTCTFTTECFESDGCSDTEFSMSVESDDGGANLVTDAETIPVGLGGSEEIKVYAGVSASGSAFHLLTIAENNDARYTTHIFDGPLMVNYLGSCAAE